jgi:hypothetical protein
MDSIFFLKLFLSLIIGGLWTVMATVVADKFGSKIGGLIAGLPSTGLFSLFFMGWTLGPVFAVSATTIVPAIVGVENIFVVVYIALARKNFWLAIGAALLTWFVFVLGLVIAKFNSYTTSLLLYAISLFISSIIVERLIRISSAKGKTIRYSPSIIIIRGLLSGIIVALAVTLGKLGGPILGGAFAAFPALFTSTIIITYFAHGAAFSAATMKSSLYCIISFVIHSIMVRYTYVPLGIIWGTLVSMLVSFTSGYLVYKFVVTRLR